MSANLDARSVVTLTSVTVYPTTIYYTFLIDGTSYATVVWTTNTVTSTKINLVKTVPYFTDSESVVSVLTVQSWSTQFLPVTLYLGSETAVGMVPGLSSTLVAVESTVDWLHVPETETTTTSLSPTTSTGKPGEAMTTMFMPTQTHSSTSTAAASPAHRHAQHHGPRALDWALPFTLVSLLIVLLATLWHHRRRRNIRARLESERILEASIAEKPGNAGGAEENEVYQATQSNIPQVPAQELPGSTPTSFATISPQSPSTANGMPESLIPGPKPGPAAAVEIEGSEAAKEMA